MNSIQLKDERCMALCFPDLLNRILKKVQYTLYKNSVILSYTHLRNLDKIILKVDCFPFQLDSAILDDEILLLFQSQLKNVFKYFEVIKSLYWTKFFKFQYTMNGKDIVYRNLLWVEEEIHWKLQMKNCHYKITTVCKWNYD